MFLFCAEPPAAWTDNVLVSGTHFSIESLRRRLLHRAPDNVQALIIQLQTGNGSIHSLRRRTTPNPTEELAGRLDETQSATVSPLIETPVINLEKKPATSTEPAKTEIGVVPKAATIERLAVIRATMIKRLAGYWQSWKTTRQRISYFAATMFTRLLPGVSNKPLQINPGTMLFIAVAVPLAVVAMAMTVYFSSGREGEHKRYMDMALSTAVQAQSAPDINLQKEYWGETLVWLDKAEAYGISDESIALREHVRQTLDEMDGITRVEALPALKEILPASLHITQLAASGTDVYALDATEGKVWRMFLTNSGYEIDPNFQCGPQPNLTINPLIDLVSLPPFNPLKATIMAMDGSGNLLYCIPGETPGMATLTPPSMDWGEIIAFTLRMSDLYVLDRGSNAIWKTEGTDFTFGEEPKLYFEHDIPQRLNEVIDLAVSDDELFLLRENGKMISCLYQIIELETCTDPAPYGDLRPGREHDPLDFPDVKFTQIQATSPPDPSIYMLDTNHNTVYQFSLRLNSYTSAYA